MSKEFYVQYRLKNDETYLDGPYPEWISDLVINDIPRRQFDRDNPEYLDVASAIKIDATGIQKQREAIINLLRR